MSAHTPPTDPPLYPPVLCVLSLFAAAFFLSVVGCGEHEQIRSYTVAKEELAPRGVAPIPVAAGAQSANASQSADTPDRMLAAVLPAGRQAWFFKVVGPEAAVDEHEKEIIDFLSSVRLDAGRPRWEQPAGWKEDPAAQMRLATLWIPTNDKPLEMSVMALPWRGTQQELLANVNRWRGQMQLEEIKEEQLADATREVAAGDVKMTIADLRGQFQDSGMMAPFAGGFERGPARAMPESDGQLPAGHPPVQLGERDATQLAADGIDAAAVPEFEAPESWQTVPPQGIRRAMFKVTDGQQHADVTVFDFATNSGPMMTDPLENVNRWRREVGLEPLQREDLQHQSESLEIDGRPATYVALVPDAEQPQQSQAPEATLAAMVTNDDRIWFFKMNGSRQLVADQQDEFKMFLESVNFADEGGKSDGNE